MNSAATIVLADACMKDFARWTGLDPVADPPKRYLWTDAFAVCNYLGLFRKTGDERYRELAIRLIDQVHHTLGRHRIDDPRAGWISGLPPAEGEDHPTAGGLRIGKPLPERRIDEPYDGQKEWDQDGQYFHYLTRWMHALACAGRVTGNPEYARQAVELARTAHAKFTYDLPSGGKRMYWKMSIDLSRPLVTSMGQHDPLDGLVTLCELNLDIPHNGGTVTLAGEIADMAGIARGMPMETGDPLGIGGLLWDVSWIVQIAGRGGPVPAALLLSISGGAQAGLKTFRRDRTLDRPAQYRLAFRELGLSIGLAGLERLPDRVLNIPVPGQAHAVNERLHALGGFLPLRGEIERFWLDPGNRDAETWTGHKEINTVMLATSLVPDGFLEI